MAKNTPEAFRIGNTNTFKVESGPHAGHIVTVLPFPTMHLPKKICSCGSQCTGYPESGDLTLQDICYWNTSSRPQGV